MKDIKRFLKRKSVIAAIVIGIVAFFLLDAYPNISGIVLIAAIVFLAMVLQFDIDPRKRKEERAV